MNLENFLNYFNEKFLETKNKCSDNREFSLLEMNMGGTLKHEVSTKESFCFSSHYNKDVIEIYYNRIRINNEYLQDQLNFSREQLLKEISYLANHEYGHTLFCESSKKLREFKVKSDIIYNKYEKFNCFVFLRVLSEFSADLEAFNNNLTLPEIKFRTIYEYFKSNLSRHSTTILPTTRNFQYGRDGIDQYQLPFLTNLSIFYAFNKWDDLKEVFDENRLSKLLTFSKHIFDYLKKMIEFSPDLILRRKSISKLLKTLDVYFYDDIIFNNEFNNELQCHIQKLIEKI